MGSLPNLHELDKEEKSSNPGNRHGKDTHCYAYQQQPATQSLTHDQRNRILHRHSTHCKGPKGRHQTTNIVYDDFMLEQMAAYSPISARSSRQINHTIRRRDSINSSIGANSVRRLIAVVRSTNSRMGPVYSRKILIRNLIIMCVAHILVTSSFLPFVTLQGSVSAWSQPIHKTDVPITINVGSLLLMLMHVFAALSTIFGPSLIQKFGPNMIFIVSYVILTIFYATHVYPLLYVLIPTYICVGLVLGPLCVARITFLMTISTKLSYIFGEDDEETKQLRRTCVVRRVARAFQAATDFGLILGSILSAILITYTINLKDFSLNAFLGVANHNDSMTNQTQLVRSASCLNRLNCSDSEPCRQSCESSSQAPYDYNAFLDDIFDVDELGDRLCGSQACPSAFKLGHSDDHFRVLPRLTSWILIGVFLCLTIVAVFLSGFGLDRIKMYVYQDPLERSEGLAALRAVRDSFKDVRLQLAAPLSVFIGIEQAFMYSDFSKSYVVCTLGIHRLNLVFLCMGLLQSIAACTLSMLLRTIRRYYVIAVGFAFHGCLLMVQMLWKPMGDDPALFYVISAAWGVCNAIWEMINFTLLTGLYSDNWEAPFANSIFFRFLGLTVAFGIHGLFCNWIKLYFLAFFMLFAVVPFAWLEVRLENMRRVKNMTRL